MHRLAPRACPRAPQLAVQRAVGPGQQPLPRVGVVVVADLAHRRERLPAAAARLPEGEGGGGKRGRRGEGEEGGEREGEGEEGRGERGGEGGGGGGGRGGGGGEGGGGMLRLQTGAPARRCRSPRGRAISGLACPAARAGMARAPRPLARRLAGAGLCRRGCDLSAGHDGPGGVGRRALLQANRAPPARPWRGGVEPRGWAGLRNTSWGSSWSR